MQFSRKGNKSLTFYSIHLIGLSECCKCFIISSIILSIVIVNVTKAMTQTSFFFFIFFIFFRILISRGFKKKRMKKKRLQLELIDNYASKIILWHFVWSFLLFTLLSRLDMFIKIAAFWICLLLTFRAINSPDICSFPFSVLFSKKSSENLVISYKIEKKKKIEQQKKTWDDEKHKKMRTWRDREKKRH